MKNTKITILLIIILTSCLPSLIHSQDNDMEAVYGRYGPDSLICMKNIALYREAYKQWKAGNYQNESIRDVIGPWRWVFIYCPKGSPNTYIEGARILSYMIETAPDKDLRNNYIDTLMMLYNQRIKYFGNEGFVLGRKGMDLSAYRPEESAEIFEDLKRSVELEGENSSGPVLSCYLKAAVRMVEAGEADSAVIFEAYDLCSAIIGNNLQKNGNNPGEKANWEIVRHNIELTFEPYATCEDLVSICRKKFREKPDDTELLKKITKLLDEKKCQGDSLYIETIRQLYFLDPSPASSYLYGKMLLTEGKYAEAIGYLKEGDKMDDQSMVMNSYKYISEAYRAIRNFQGAREYALKALAINPNDGETYLMIGDMYAESARECGENDLTRRAAYWAAVDKYMKAKLVDPSIAKSADKRISAYSVYFPSAQTIISYDLKEGDTYKIDCWINEETNVRSSE